MDYADEETVRVVENDKTVEQRIREQKEARKLETELKEAYEEKGREMILSTPPSDLQVLGSSHAERRARILNEATDLIEESYNKLRLAINTMSICDINAQEKYAGLVREMGKAVRDFSGKL